MPTYPGHVVLWVCTHLVSLSASGAEQKQTSQNSTAWIAKNHWCQTTKNKTLSTVHEPKLRTCGKNLKHFPWHMCIQERKIKKKIKTWRAHALQTDRNIPVHAFFFLPPSRRQERLYQRRSLKTSQNKLFKSNIWRKQYSIQTEITQHRLPR